MASVGYNGKVETPGAAVSASALPTTNTTGNSYQINDAAKRALDPTQAVTVYDGGVAVAAANVTVDFLFGVVTLSAPPGGAVTVDAYYLPLLELAQVRGFDLECSVNLQDFTHMHATDAHRKRMMGIKDASGSVSLLDITTDIDAGGGTVTPYALFAAGSAILLSLTYGVTKFRAWVLLEGIKTNTTFDDLVNHAIAWKVAPQNSVASGAASGEAVSYGFGT